MEKDVRLPPDGYVQFWFKQFIERWMSENCESGNSENRSLLRTEKI